MPKKSAKLITGKSAANNPVLSDNKEALEFELLKAQRLDNAYAEWLYPDNTKSKRALSLEHKIARSSLKWRIQGGKARVAEDENRQRLTHLKEKALKDQCL